MVNSSQQHDDVHVQVGRLDERVDDHGVRLTTLEETVNSAKDGLSIRMDRAERVLVLVTKPVLWIVGLVVGTGVTVLVTILVYRSMGQHT
jgi:hypothetical protein